LTAGKTLSLFDFDGTLTRRDSFKDFLIFAVGIRTFLTGVVPLSPWILLYLLRVISNEKAKQRVFAYFFKGWSRERFQDIGQQFARERLSHLLRPEAAARLKWHQRQNHTICVVSASFEDYLKDWCDEQGLDLIGTKAEVKNNVLTGQFATANCYGPEKLRRVKERYELGQFQTIYAYGDSRGDKELLSAAHQKFYRCFGGPPDPESKRPDIRRSVVLFAIFLLLYAGLGKALEQTSTKPFLFYDVFFDLDVPRVIFDITHFSADHWRAETHPIYQLFVNPIGVTLRHLPIFNGREADVAILVNSATGALNVALAFLLFRFMGGSPARALLLSLIFGFSMSHLFFSMVPETGSLGTTSLLITYALFWQHLYRKPVSFFWWVLAGIFSLGITSTDIIQTCICFSVCRLAGGQGSGWQRIRAAAKPIILYPIVVFLATALLAVIQKKIYPSTDLFFLPSSYANTDTTSYVKMFILTQPLETIIQLIKHFFVVNIVSCLPDHSQAEGLFPITTCTTTWKFPGVGYLTILIWLLLICAGIKKDHFKKFGWYYTGLASCLAFNFLLHIFFSGFGEFKQPEYFLFTCYFTLLVLMLFLTRYLFDERKTSLIGLALLAAGLALNNGGVAGELIKRYDNFAPAKVFHKAWDDYQAVLKRYRQGTNLPEETSFVFDLGEHGKFLYKDGILRNMLTKEILLKRSVAQEAIIPPARAVLLYSLDGEAVLIKEENHLLFIEIDGELEKVLGGESTE
jgi:phosphatidylglycerophosphatase C